jgi:hypothetical protein
MPKHIWSLVCRDTKVDDVSNNLSITDVLEDVQFDIKTDSKGYKPGKPIATELQLHLVSVFYRDKPGNQEQLSTTAVVLDPQGTKLGEFNADITFQKKNRRMRSIMRFESIVLTTTGTYMFQVYINENDKRRNVTTIPLDVQLVVNGSEVKEAS